MHAGQFIELATSLSFKAKHFAQSTRAEMVDSEEFWSLSKDKLDHWNKTLSIFKEDVLDPQHDHNSWTAISCVVEEILCSEFFVRIASAAFIYKDQLFEMTLNGPIARSVFLFHLEARLRALELIEIGLDQKVEEAKELNELRRRLESWCDLLLGFFPHEIAQEFSIDSGRHKEFNRDISEETVQSRKNVERLLRISIQEYGRKLLQNPAANPTLNRQLATLFGFLQSDSPAENVPFSSHSINDLTAEAERWIDDYMTVK